MDNYAQQMIAMMNRTGQPQTTTSTQTTKQPNEGLDISGLMMMLMLDKLFPTANKAGVGAENALIGGMQTPMPNIPAPAMPNLGNIGITQAPAGLDLQKLIQLLASIQR